MAAAALNVTITTIGLARFNTMPTWFGRISRHDESGMMLAKSKLTTPSIATKEENTLGHAQAFAATVIADKICIYEMRIDA